MIIVINLLHHPSSGPTKTHRNTPTKPLNATLLTWPVPVRLLPPHITTTHDVLVVDVVISYLAVTVCSGGFVAVCPSVSHSQSVRSSAGIVWSQ